MSKSTESTTRDELLAQVESQRETYRRVIAIIGGDGPDDDDLAWLADDLGVDLDDYHAVPNASELGDALVQWIDEDTLEVVRVYEGATKREASYKGCRVVVCIGGPHVELDTIDKVWRGWWGGDKVELSASSDVCEYFDGDDCEDI